ncbi:variable large family protein (plasmid) [Borreliella finlandensis]|uniref:variable large family protein n=1 Tax=Borreliella finlandensis TaxID=498741 RepID=UPI003AF194E6
MAKGIKGIVDAAGKAITGKPGDVLAGVKDAAKDNEEAGKLFAGSNAAVNPIAAAIGTDNGGGADFVDGEMKKSDKIAAAIVLRGLAKDGKFAAVANNSGKENVKNTVESAVGEVSEWLEEMIKAAGEAAAAGSTGGSGEKIGDTGADDKKGKEADESSVTGIAKGIKGIVDAAGKAIGGKPGGVLADVKDAADNNNEEAGKLFAGSKGNGAVAVDAAAIGKAAAAVSAVSGEQILKAIVGAAGAAEKAKEGQAPGAAANPIEAAIGTDGNGANFVNGEMKKSDKIAAAIVLRGLAKDGKFAADANNSGKENVKSAVESAVGEVSGWLEEMIKAAEAAAGSTGGEEKIGDTGDDEKGKEADASSVTGIAKGIKGIVDAAGKAVTGKPGDVLAGVKDADNNNVGAGKLFAGSNGAAAVDAAAIGKAAAAVSAVSGEQILKAIVDAADAAEKAKEGQAPSDAANPIEAAIGTNNNGADFDKEMKKSDKIAAAIVLRGLAKDGKFAADDANGKENVKSTVESAVGEVSGWLEEMIKAAGEAAGSTGGEEKIGDADDGQKGEKADASSVTGIAKGIKGIVDAAGKAITGKPGGVLAGVKDAADDKDNKEAGKLFADSNGNDDAAVSAVSGEQILKAIVGAAEKAKGQGKAPGAAANPIAAAIGTNGNGADFGNDMKKSDKIAAAIVLRGLAKGGKFAAVDANGGKENVKSAVESAVGEVSGWLEEMIKAAGEAAAAGSTGGGEKIGDTGDDDGQKGGKADESSVTGIAKGIKGGLLMLLGKLLLGSPVVVY